MEVVLSFIRFRLRAEKWVLAFIDVLNDIFAWAMALFVAGAILVALWRFAVYFWEWVAS